ncbi:MAG: DUF4199 domain-containing protein [Saprospiraceae bacterium]|nr:DUF4199 domain-containing protein [Saprospiraceae bacterium]
MEKQSHFSNASRFGLMMGGILVIVSLLLYLLGMVDMETGKSGILGNLLNYVISIGAIILGIQAYKKSNDGFLTLGDGVKQGMLIGLVGGFVVAIYTVVFFMFIAPDMLDTIRETALAQAEQQGSMNEDSEDMVNSMMDIFVSPWFFFVTVIFMKFCLGLIIGLITGAIMKNERPYSADEDMETDA